MTLLIEGGTIVTVDDEDTLLDPGWVLADGGTIAEVGAGDAPAGRQKADTVIDAAGCAVLPGFVNAHTHLFQTLFRGIADDRTLLDWLRESIWPGAVELEASDLGVAAELGLLENLRSGATSVIDHQYVHTADGSDEMVCQAADRTGARLLLSYGWADRNYLPDLTQSGPEAADAALALAETWRDSDRIRISLGPLIPWGCSDEAMATTLEPSEALGQPFHIHCAETVAEIDMSTEERGMGHVSWLESIGALRPGVQLAHGIHLDDQELDLVAKRGAVVVHCPVSNMYLASGVARIPDMRERGIRVALATDGPGSNNAQDFFETLKAAALLHKLTTGDPARLPPTEILRMACRDGAEAFGAGSSQGVLEAGRAADLVVVDLDTLFSAPTHSVVSNLVYTASGRDVRDVVVAGRVLLRDGTFTEADPGAAVAAARESAARMVRRAGLASRLA